jgi:hypothetical protein
MIYLKKYENYIELKPSDFAKVNPRNSVFRKSEHETIARNIMVILSRTGNKFRHLSWKEYKKERLKDGQFTDMEKHYFDDVLSWCVGPKKAKKFSIAWDIKAEAEIDAEKYNI